MEGYTVRTVNKHLWRFISIMSFEDAYQEAFVKFLEFSEKYAGTVDNPRWFMALYKRGLANLITDLANSANRMRRQVCFSELQEEGEAPYEETLFADPCATNLEFLLDNAPEEIRQVLSLLSSSNSSVLDVVAQSWQQQGKYKETGNQLLCNLLGYDARLVDLVTATRDYLEDCEGE